jgi:hypothetical protein
LKGIGPNTYLQWRLNHAQPDERFKVVADVIRHHRQHHARQVLEAACELAATCGDIEQVLARFIGAEQQVLDLYSYIGGRTAVLLSVNG